MPKFSADKIMLEQTLSLFDTNGQIPASVSKLLTKRSSAFDQCLILMLLEHICCLQTTDPARRKRFYQFLLEKLEKDNIIKVKAFARAWNAGLVDVVKKPVFERFGGYMKSVFMDMGDPGDNAVISGVIPMETFPNTYEQNFKEVGVIARGGFGIVYKAVHKIDGITYAVKKIFYPLTVERQNKVLSEVRSIAALSHPNVVSYKNCWGELLNRDDAEDGSSQSDASSFASKDFSCSTPCSTDFQASGSNASEVSGSDSSQQLTPHSSPSVEKKGLSAIAEVPSSDVSLEDTDACLNQIEEMSTLGYPDDSHSDSLVVFEPGDPDDSHSDSLVVFEPGKQSSSSAVTFLSEEVGTPSSSSSEASREQRLKAILFIQMEYCDSDLKKWLEDRMEGEELPFQKDVGDIFRDIVKGVVHIHANHIIHRDLKPANIFYSKRDGAMKIGDFGLATLNNAEATEPRTNGPRPHTSNLGTLPYTAPEQRERTDYDEKVDVYSLGIILFELLFRVKTRSEFHHTLGSVLTGDSLPPEITDRFPKYVDLLTNLLQRDPTQRMSAQEILKHPMLQDITEVEKRKLLFENNSLKMTLKLRELELEQARKEISDLKAQIQQLNSTSR